MATQFKLGLAAMGEGMKKLRCRNMVEKIYFPREEEKEDDCFYDH